MKIAYDHQFFSMFGYSGITRYLYELIPRIARNQGVSVSLFMGWHTNNFDFKRHKEHFAHFFGVRRPLLPKTALLFNTLNELMFPLFLSRSRAGIYHQTYYRNCAQGFRGKRVLTVYDMTYELFPEKFSAHDPSVREKKASMDNADALIAISHATKADMVRLCGYAPERITVIHLANSLTVPSPAQGPIDEPYILYVGQRVPHKNFTRLLSAYCQSARVNRAYRLLCFGGGPVTADESAVLSKHGCSGRMLWRPGPDEALASCYSHASLLVYPSLYEGFGMPLIEAMHYGCPCIASNAGSLPEIGGEAALYFDPLDTGELAARMEQALFSQELRATMSGRGRMREKDFSWDECARRTLALYESLA